MTRVKVFDDWKSVIHILIGVLVGALGGTVGFIIATIFFLYQMGESKSMEEFLGDWFEFWWGWFVWLVLHM